MYLLFILKSRFSLNFKGDELQFKSAANKLNILDKDGKVTGSIGVNSSTVVFDIPLGEKDTDNMAVRNSKMFTDGSTYNVLAYDMTEDHVATVLIVTKSGSGVGVGAEKAYKTAKKDNNYIVFSN